MPLHRRGRNPMKILIADDHPLIRAALPVILNQLGDPVRILESADFPSTFRVVEKNPDLVLLLLDLDMPGMDRFEAIARLRQGNPGLAIVILSNSQQPADIQRALELDVAGYIPKTLAPEIMLHGLRLVLAGGRYVPPELMEPIRQPASADDIARPWAEHSEFSRLTRRQLDVLRLLVDGKSNKEIGLLLELSDSTVKVHVGGVFRALKVRNRAQAVLAAERSGIFQDGDR